MADKLSGQPHVNVPADAVQAQALAQAQQGQVYHRGVAQYHQPQPAAQVYATTSLEQQPPPLPRRGGGPSCLCSIGVMALLGCVSL